jgi:hypothetical protein
MAGCAAPGAQVSQILSSSEAGTPSASATPTAPPPTSQPSATPLPTLAFEPPADILPPFSVTAVAVDALRIREQPRLSAPMVATAGKGELVYLNSYGGRVAADGLDWYPVGFAAGYRAWPKSPPGSSLNGWAAVGSGDQSYLELVAPRCPAGGPDLAALLGMGAWERLACFGDRPLTVEGTYGCGGCGGTTGGDFAPQWLAFPGIGFMLRVDWQDTSGVVQLRVAPDLGITYPADGSIVRVTGHFNDPASATCTMTRFNGDQGGPVDPASAHLYCREQFVLDAFEIIGVDPAYLGP